MQALCAPNSPAAGWQCVWAKLKFATKRLFTTGANGNASSCSASQKIRFRASRKL